MYRNCSLTNSFTTMCLYNYNIWTNQCLCVWCVCVVCVCLSLALLCIYNPLVASSMSSNASLATTNKQMCTILFNRYLLFCSFFIFLCSILFAELVSYVNMSVGNKIPYPYLPFQTLYTSRILLSLSSH